MKNLLDSLIILDAVKMLWNKRELKVKALSWSRIPFIHTFSNIVDCKMITSIC